MAKSPNPKLLYLVLCDGLNTEPNTGKKSFIGIFDRIITDAIPGVFPSMMIAVGLEGGEGLFEVGIVLRDPQGKEIFQSPIIPVTPKEPYRREDLIVQVNGLRLADAGRYEIQVVLNKNKQPAWIYPLYVEEKQATQSVVQ